MSWHKVGGVRNEALDTANYARAMAELVGWSHWSEADFVREEASLEAHAEDLRRLVAKEQVSRLRSGNTRPVTTEDLVSNIVRPDGYERPSPEPIIVPTVTPDVARALMFTEPTTSTVNVPRGLTLDLTLDGAVERPVEVGVAGKASAKGDVRALMRGAGLGRQRSHDED